MTCEHGFIGACAICDGCGQFPSDLSTHDGDAVSVDDDLVEEAHACPGCGERRVDELVFQDDDDERVRCSTCGCVYDPASGKAVRR